MLLLLARAGPAPWLGEAAVSRHQDDGRQAPPGACAWPPRHVQDEQGHGGEAEAQAGTTQGEGEDLGHAGTVPRTSVGCMVHAAHTCSCCSNIILKCWGSWHRLPTHADPIGKEETHTRMHQPDFLSNAQPSSTKLALV